MNSHMLTGILLAAGAALGFSAKAIFVKLAYVYQVDAITLLMLRMVFALPFFVVIAMVEEKRASRRISVREMLLITGLGLIGYYLSSLLDFIGLQYISAGLERLVLFVYPTIVVLISALFFGKKIGREVVMALLLSYAGIALAMSHDIQFAGSDMMLGSAAVFAATVTYALFLVGGGEIIPRVGARRFTAYAMLVSSLAVIIHFLLVRDVDLIVQPLPVYGYSLAMALFSTVIPAFMLAAAIQRIGASHTSIVGALGPVATIGMAVVFLSEPVSLMQMIGAMLVIAGVMMLTLKKRS